MDAAPLTVKEACAFLRCGATYLRAHADEIGVIRLRGKLLFEQADLVAWLKRHKAQASMPAPVAAPKRRLSVVGRGATNPITQKGWSAR